MAQTSESVTLVNNALDAFNKGTVETLGKLFTPELQHSVTATIKDSKVAFPDLQYKIDHAEAHGDQVGFTYTGTGTHKGTLAGQAATGKTAQWHGSGIATLVNGKIASMEIQEDHLSKMIQLGIWPHVNPSVTGNWVGSAQGITVNLTLVQHGNAITGTATVTGLHPIPVTGTVNYPNVTLHGNLNGVQISFTGAFKDANTIAGTLTALGSSLPVTLTRH